MNYPTKAELLGLIAKTQFRPFEEADWWAFAGCESKEPMIGETDEYIIVLDGAQVNIVHPDDGYGGQLFELSQLA